MADLVHRALMGGIVNAKKYAATDFTNVVDEPLCIDLFEGDDSRKTPTNFVLVVSQNCRAIQNATDALVLYNTGTITIVGGALTNMVLAVGTWPARTVKQGSFRYDVGGAGTMSAWYDATTRTDDNNLVLNTNTAGAEEVGRAYELYYHDTALYNITTATAGRNFLLANTPYYIKASVGARYLHIMSEVNTFIAYLSKIS